MKNIIGMYWEKYTMYCFVHYIFVGVLVNKIYNIFVGVLVNKIYNNNRLKK